VWVWSILVIFTSLVLIQFSVAVKTKTRSPVL